MYHQAAQGIDVERLPGRRRKSVRVLTRAVDLRRFGMSWNYAGRLRRVKFVKGATSELLITCSSFSPAELIRRCRNTHDINEYLSQKPKDIIIRSVTASQNPATDGNAYEQPHESSSVQPESIKPSSRCPIFEEKGECKYGLKCRFLGGHVKRTDDGSLELLCDDKKIAQRKLDTTELNFITPDTIKLLRTRKVCSSTTPSRKSS